MNKQKWPKLRPVPPEGAPNRRSLAIAGLADYQAQFHRRLPGIVGLPKKSDLNENLVLTAVGLVTAVLLLALEALQTPGALNEALAGVMLLAAGISAWSLRGYFARKRTYQAVSRIADDSEALADRLDKWSRRAPSDDCEDARRIVEEYNRETAALERRIERATGAPLRFKPIEETLETRLKKRAAAERESQ